jgi:hypothetical protein
MVGGGIAMMALGAVATGFGAMIIVVSCPGLTVPSCHFNDVSIAGAWAIVGGHAFGAIGIPLIIIGAKHDPVRPWPPRLAPKVRVGAAGLTLRWDL